MEQNTPGHRVTMVEFGAANVAESGDFFASVFGWGVTPYGPEYVDVTGGGIGLGFQGDPEERPSAPLVIIQVEDLDDARRRIEAHGGRVTVEPFDFPGGRRLHFAEPGGNELAVWVPRP